MYNIMLWCIRVTNVAVKTAVRFRYYACACQYFLPSYPARKSIHPSIYGATAPSGP